MKMFRGFLLFVFLAGVVALTGCARNVMTGGDINRPLEVKPEKTYSVAWIKVNPILGMSEEFGSNHFLGDEDGMKRLGAKVQSRKGYLELMVITQDPLDPAKKAVVHSRSGRFMYDVNGQRFWSRDGVMAPKFDWKQVNSLSESGAEIWSNVEAGSERDKQVKEVLGQIALNLDKTRVPGLFEQVVQRIGKITTEDVMIGAATNFQSLYLIFGVRLFAIIDAVVQQADLSLPYYDTALVDRFQLAQTLDPLFGKVGVLHNQQKAAYEEWLRQCAVVMKQHEENQAQFQQDRKAWLELFNNQ